VSFQYLILEREDGVAILTINRPQALNALNEQVLEELSRALEEVAGDPEVRVLIITGAGDRAFVAGADIRHMRDLDVAGARSFAERGQRVLGYIENMDKVVIAAINGYCLGGGCELAMACDIRLAARGARLGQPEVTVGVPPGFGATQRLPRLVGLGKAKELILTGEMVDAEEAAAMGLVNRVCEPDRLMDEARALARKIASRAPVALALAKRALNRSFSVGLETGLAYEAELFASAFASEDQKEGMSAFLDKRKPSFKGR